jgi:hypothetical protein
VVTCDRAEYGEGGGTAMRVDAPAGIRIGGASLALALLVTACGALRQDAGDRPAAHPQQELSVDDARALGLTRTDAVSVLGPTLVHTGGRPVPFHVQVVVPPLQATPRLPATTTPAGPRTVDLDFSGSCLLSGTLHPRGLVPAPLAAPGSSSSAPTGGATRAAGMTSVRATVTVRVPPGVESCDVVVDAWVAGRTYTGDDLTAIFRA